MKHIYSIILCYFCGIGISYAQKENNYRVWSDTPAYTVLFENQKGGVPLSKPVKSWEEGEGTNYLNEYCDSVTHGKYPNPVRLWEAEPYPIGNGRLAASVFHGDKRDRYALNEVSFWAGGRNAGTINNKGDKGFDVSGPDVDKDGFGTYQPVGDLIIDFNSPAQPEHFVRQITLDKGVVESSSLRNGNRVSSLAFCSYPDQVMVLHYESQEPKKLNLLLSFATQREQDEVTVNGNQELILNCQLKNGMGCRTLIKVQQEGGRLVADKESVRLEDADNCTLFIYIATNYEMDAEKDFRGVAAKEKLDQQIRQTASYSYQDLLNRHLSDYAHLYQRQELNIAKASDARNALPTPKRLEAYRKSPTDTGLEELIFRFGRYLMIQTSRPGSLPAGLQGIWNGMIAAPWGNDYHSNINFQMVYWLPEVGNLSECHLSMIDYLKAMRSPFKDGTREYLQAIGEPVDSTNDGWIVYTSHNPFGAGGWQVNLPGAAWYGLHMWEHYSFTQDTAYLREEAYPMMKELCHYWEKHLKSLGEGGKGFCSNYQEVDITKYPELKGVKEGTLVVPAGWSPEHGPRGEDGVAHDQEIVSELFQNTIKAAQVLRVDADWVEQLQEKVSRLYVPQIGKRGNLMEWMIDRDPETDHRHTSHLFAVFPGSTISIAKTPQLAQAACKSLEFRKTTGDSRRSWAWTWRSLLWSRLHDGEQAHNMIEGLISYNMLDNLFTSHKIPLQIDGNYGIAAAMIEMLIQSHSDAIELLPAVCPQWTEGDARGLKARGNIEVDLAWKDGQVTSWKLYSPQPRPVKVRVNGKEHTVTPELRTGR